MKFLRKIRTSRGPWVFRSKGTPALNVEERHALDRLLSACKVDPTGTKARQITFCLLDEAVLYGDLTKFSLYPGFIKLYAHYHPNDPCAAIDKAQPSGVK
jgi:hypothetical protein